MYFWTVLLRKALCPIEYWKWSVIGIFVTRHPKKARVMFMSWAWTAFASVSVAFWREHLFSVRRWQGTVLFPWFCLLSLCLLFTASQRRPRHLRALLWANVTLKWAKVRLKAFWGNLGSVFDEAFMKKTENVARNAARAVIMKRERSVKKKLALNLITNALSNLTGANDDTEQLETS